MPTPKHILDPNQWIDKYADMLYSFALVRVNREEIAKDLVQDTFLAALRNVAGFRGEISEKNWLIGILKNKIIDHYRKKSTLSLNKIIDEQSKQAPYFDEAGHWEKSNAPVEWEGKYHLPLETQQFYEVLERCKKKLSEMQSSVFSMKYLDDMDADEICKELGISTSNLWVLMHRAKLQLRECLEKNQFNF